MKLEQLTNEVNEIYYNDSSSYKTISSIQKQLLAVLGADTDIKAINRDKIIYYYSYLKKQGDSANTINNKMAYLSKVLSEAEEKKLIESKPKLIYNKKKNHKRDKTINTEVYKAMKKYAKRNKLRELYQAIVIGYNTGMRISNILAIKGADNGYIRIWENKTDEAYSVPLNKTLKRLWKFFKPFTLNYRQIQYQFSTMIKELNIDSKITLHSLRHTTCTRLIIKGVPVPVVQKVMNQKNIQTTLLYTHIKDKQLEEAVSML